MRRLLCIVVVLLLLTVPLALAHSGRTDSDGGHYDRSTGEYHFHHGMSAHQHPGGVCPYDDKPAATVKPTKFASVYAYRSDQYANAMSVTARPTAAPASKEPFGKELRMKIIFALGIAVVILAVGIIFCIHQISLLREKCANLEERNKRIWNSNTELNKEVQDLKHLRQVFDQLLPFIVALASEAYEKRRDALMISSYLHPIGCNDPSLDPVMVYVTDGASKKFHMKVHGVWFSTSKIVIQEAILKGYQPCAICCPQLRIKDHSLRPLVWTSDEDMVFYHNTCYCENKLYPNGISLTEASRTKRLRPCKICKPTTYIYID